MTRPKFLTAAIITGVPLSAARADTLRLGSAAGEPSTVVLLPVTLQKSHPVVAVQFELKYPAAQLAVPSVTVNAPGADHTAGSAETAAGVTRVVVYSPTNAELPAALEIQLPLDLQAASPDGGPSIELQNIVFTDAAGGLIPSSAAYTLAEAWRRAHFTETERASPALIGDSRDPDGDGLPNLFELAAGADPRTPEPGRIGAPAVESDTQQGKRFLTLTFRRGKSATAQNAVSVTPEASADLQAWSTAGIGTEPTGAEDAISIELKASLDTAGEESQFLRLKVRRTE